MLRLNTLLASRAEVKAAPRIQPAVVVALVYLILISLAEITGALINQAMGITIQTLIFFGLIIHSVLNIDNPLGKMLLSLTLAPMIRIASYTVPLLFARPFASYVFIYLPIALAAFLVMWRLRMKPPDVGLTIRMPRWQLVIACTGVVFGLAEYLILRYPALIPFLSWTNPWIPGLTLLVTTGFVEELVFRGVMQRACADALGKWTLAYVSFIFAIIHVIHQNFWDIVLVFFIALFFAWCVKKTGSLLGVAVGHGVTNSVLFLVAPFVLKGFGV
ncbi:MAG: CPBP family intramembrane metalloprotease [Chloroflexi bacterium]|nr:CPBP family intramembrane metalloprotease [Chloroflexota bacterium]